MLQGVGPTPVRFDHLAELEVQQREGTGSVREGALGAYAEVVEVDELTVQVRFHLVRVRAGALNSRLDGGSRNKRHWLGPPSASLSTSV
jgi:hypothetical protein